jgi:uncharacterized protein (DUF427 family)
VATSPDSPAEGLRRRVAPGPGQESVWDYPRPPRIEPDERRVRVILEDVVVADTRRALKVLETSQPPAFYLPLEDIDRRRLAAAAGTTFCEWKGTAAYCDVVAGERLAARAAWHYPEPTPPFLALIGHVAFYPARVDCFVGDERARAQGGDYYGGWITDEIVGPFKGGPGTEDW